MSTVNSKHSIVQKTLPSKLCTNNYKLDNNKTLNEMYKKNSIHWIAKLIIQ